MVLATARARLRHSASTLITFFSSLAFSLDHHVSLSFIFLSLSPQNDDGPDVRAGSGDILLVHATETDRKGTAESMTRLVLSPCVWCIQDSMLLGFQVTGTALFLPA